MHTDSKYIKKIPLPSYNKKTYNEILAIVDSLEKGDYMSENWIYNLENLNIAIYKAYGINSELANYIDCEMKAIQSKRWFIND